MTTKKKRIKKRMDIDSAAIIIADIQTEAAHLLAMLSTTVGSTADEEVVLFQAHRGIVRSKLESIVELTGFTLDNIKPAQQYRRDNT